ncbi:MAG: 2-nitropropane dioxygenase [Desulfuromonas sp. SDB]|nr:MAG: 2-nitropropane dioxygenase [Desulfuromonas sp. SDB]
MNKLMPKLTIDNLQVEMPIIQGGMGVGISLSGLASAVANEGGIGVISSVGIGLLEPDFQSNLKQANQRALRSEIRKAKQRTNGVIGVNVMVAVSDFEEMVQIAVEEEVDVLLLGAGLVLKLPKAIKSDNLGKMKTKIIPIVSSDRAAKLIFNSWDRKFNYVPDAVVVEGPLAGGHLGFKMEQIDNPEFCLEKIVPSVINGLEYYRQKYGKQIPVIAAGGIYTGEDIYKFLELGAKGVQMGTRFVATNECDASYEFKQAYLNCKFQDIKIIKSPLGLLGRAIENSFLKDVAKGEKKPYFCPWRCLKVCDCNNAPYCIGEALKNAKLGLLEKGFAFAGANAFRIEKIQSVKELFAELVREYSEKLRSLIKQPELV